MTIILILLLIGLYFVPTMAAADRQNHVGAIFALNLFLGWTMIGWVVALVLALWSNNAPPKTEPSTLDRVLLVNEPLKPK